jgi:hypothetical protein
MTRPSPQRPGTAVRVYVLALLISGASASPMLAQQEGQQPPAVAVPAQRAAEPPALLVTGNLDAAPRPTAIATHATGSIDIDARLDEPSWAAAPVIDQFVQQNPRKGAPASERTEVKILYDDDNLYVGAELYYKDINDIVRTGLQRDANTGQGDAFSIGLDTFNDKRTGAIFFVNPGGALRDALTADDGRARNLPWNSAGRTKARTVPLADGGAIWVLELAIPWSSLRFDGSKEEQIWGINLFRRIRHANEEVVWAPMERGLTVYNVSRNGTLTGIKGISPGRNLSLKPYVVSTRSEGTLRTETDVDSDAGADLKYGITSGVTLDLTYNTDFSQVEADRPQVNLSRFSLFFPEQREFFLENLNLFQFGDLSGAGFNGGASERDLTLFHSRRIGLTAKGAPLPILGGGRISGTAGPLSLGFLDMQTRGVTGSAAENFAVARVRNAITPNLNVGGIFINRTTTDGPEVDNQSYGIDADFTAFRRYLLVQGYIAGTEGTLAPTTADPNGSEVPRDYAGKLSVAWKGPLWEFGAMYRRLGDDFLPGTGFVQRKGINHLYATAAVRPQVKWGPVQFVSPSANVQHYTLLDGGLETREIESQLGVEFTDGSSANFNVTNHFEAVHTAFTVGDGKVQPGDYNFTSRTVSYGTSQGRPLSASLNFGYSGYYGGTNRSIGGGVLGRLGDRAILDLSATTNRIELPGQATVNASAYTANVDVYFSTSVVASGLLQYDQTAREMLNDLRLRWIHAPLSDLYLVLTERRDTRNDVLLERLLTLKVTRLLSF